MIYDDDTSRRPHLRLPLDTVEELAAAMAAPPTPVEVAEISAAVERRVEARNHPRASTSRIKADLQRRGIDVTVEQIAWVIVQAAVAS